MIKREYIARLDQSEVEGDFSIVARIIAAHEKGLSYPALAKIREIIAKYKLDTNET